MTKIRKCVCGGKPRIELCQFDSCEKENKEENYNVRCSDCDLLLIHMDNEIRKDVVRRWNKIMRANKLTTVKDVAEPLRIPF